MKLRFTGSHNQLRRMLSQLRKKGEWRVVNLNQIQFLHCNGGMMNWFPTTGAINFQGKPAAREELEKIVAACLEGEKIEKRKSINDKSVPSTANGKKISIVKASVDKVQKEDAESTLNGRFLDRAFFESEIVIGLVGAVGTELDKVVRILNDRLKVANYSIETVSISRDIIPQCTKVKECGSSDEYERITTLMDAGNEARNISGDNAILALGSAAWISSKRENDDKEHPKPSPRKAFIIKSLKHPDEVVQFRVIYPRGFYLVGVYSDEKRRHNYLIEDKRISGKKAQQLMLRDQDEHLAYGQRVTDTFHLSDVFVYSEDDEQLKQSLWRFLEIIFAHPHKTPTFDEYAMFLAFSASLRSADLSRQVGAAIAKNNEIIAIGANDCPKCGGGLFWPEYDAKMKAIIDQQDGRDYMRGEDANKIEQQKIIDDILNRASEKGLDKTALREVLNESRIYDLTEFGRVVHAEMEALLCCARNNISTRNATMYCTTFPCHNCAKHIIAAGIERVVYIEPFPKSKAAELHSDALMLGFNEGEQFIHFEPFVGIGPRRFIDLFSMRLGSGSPIKRKDKDGQTLRWGLEKAHLRLQMFPCSYLELELLAGNKFRQNTDKGESENA